MEKIQVFLHGWFSILYYTLFGVYGANGNICQIDGRKTGLSARFPSIAVSAIAGCPPLASLFAWSSVENTK